MNSLSRRHTLDVLFARFGNSNKVNGNSYGVMKMARESGSLHSHLHEYPAVTPVTQQDSADSMLGDLDCNDNTPVLLPQIDTSTSQPCLSQHNQDNVMSPSKSCVSTTSSSTSHPSLSPEDATNNDFFYDDEFSVQFDATLTGAEEEDDEADEEGNTETAEMLDSIDICSLLSLQQQIYSNNKRNGGESTYRRGLTPSYSDTCLHQFDLDFSGSEKSNNNSICCDQSFTEQINNCASSSDLSDLKSELLFTSPPPNLEHSGIGIDLSRDSLAFRLEDTLSNSFITDDERYNYDWSAHKDKYMLSFDRSPVKYSDEDMDCHDSDSINEGLNMAINQHDQVTNQKTKALNTSCHGNNTVHGTAMINHKISGSNQSLLQNDAKNDAIGETVKKNGGLTTWTQVKHGKQVRESGLKNNSVGLTTWCAISKKLPTEENCILSDIQNKKSEQNSLAVQDDNAVNTENNSKFLDSVRENPTEEPSKNSTSLFEIFKTVRSLSAEEKVDLPNNLYSPPSLPHLTTWGAKFGKPSNYGNNGDYDHSDKRLISFASLQNNNTVADNGSDSIETGGTLHLFTGDSFENGGAGTLDPNASGITLPTSSQSSERRNSHGNLIDLHDDDQVLHEAKENLEKKQISSSAFDHDEVFPSEKQVAQSLCNAEAAASYSDSLINSERLSRSLQTSNVKSKVPVSNENLKKIEENSLNFEQHSGAHPVDSTRTQNRLSKSVFLTNDTLPDLSFLNKHMAKSVTEASKTVLLAGCNYYDITEPLFVTPKIQKSEQTSLSKSLSKPVVSTGKSDKNSEKLVSVKTVEAETTQSPPVCIPKSGSRSHRTSSSSFNNSFNSSSSSGIDPGSYESPRNKVCFMPELRMHQSEGSSDGGSSETSGESCQAHKHCCVVANKVTDTRQHTETNSGSENAVNFVKCDSIVKTRSERNRRFKQRSSSCPERNLSNHGNTGHCKIHNMKPGFSSHLVDVTGACYNQGSNVDTESPICTIRHLNMSQSLPKEKLNRETKPQCHHRECSDLSPSHGHGLVCVANRVASAIHCSSHHVNCTCPNEHKFIRAVKNEHTCCCSGDRILPTKSVQTNTEKFPLKSCLSKKKPELFRQHCLSEEPELAIMRYSEEGQTRYQLVTYECPCRASASSNSDDSLPENQCKRTFEDQANEKLGTVSLQPVYLHGSLKSPCQPCVLCNGCRAPPNSPENNLCDLHSCNCHGYRQQQHRLSRSESSHEEESDSDGGRIKKSVKFSENVSYHSPYSSPHQSPKKQVNVGHAAAGHVVNVKRHNTQELITDNKLCAQGMCTHAESEAQKTFAATDKEDGPPHDFLVSPSSKTPPVIFTENGSLVDISQKRDLVKEVIHASEVILHHFSKTRDPYEKVKLGSSDQCPDITELVLTKLCPAVYAVLCDGLNQHTRSLFGKVKNSVWKVVEESSELGPSTRVVFEVFREVKGLAYLSTTWMKFNAFLLGLLNQRSVDFWLSYVHCNNKLMTRHYQADSLMRLGNGPLSNLFVDMTTALQPLAELPFKLEYNSEYRRMTRKRTQDEDGLELPVWKPNTDKVNTSVPSSVDLCNQSMDSVASSATLTMSSTSQHSADDSGKTDGQSILSTSSQQSSSEEEVVNEAQVCSTKTTSSPSLAQAENYELNNMQIVKYTADWMNWALDTLNSLPVPPIRNITRVLPDHDKLVRTPMQYLQTLVRNVTESTESVIPINGLKYRQPSSHHHGDTTIMQPDENSIDHVDSASQSSQDSSLAGVILKARNSKGTNTNVKPVMVVKDNEILSLDYYESETDFKTEEEGVIHKITKQLLEPSADVRQTVYKKGITNYEFDAEMQLPPSACKTKQKSVSRGCTASTGEIKDSQKDCKTVDIKTTTVTTPVDTASTAKQNKGWNIGPSIINFFDKLLLVDNKKPAQPSVTESGGVKLQKQKSSESLASSVSSTVSRTSSLDGATRQLAKQQKHCPAALRQVRALCHYVASDVDQLSFQKGDVMDVLEEINFDWLLCRLNKMQGLVHIACVK